MKSLRNFKIKHKLQLTGVLYLVLIAIVAYFFINSNALVKKSSEQEHALSAFSKDIRRAEMAVREYVFNRMSVDQLNEHLQQLGQRLKGNTVAENLTHVQGYIRNYHQIRSRNQAIESQINTLTEDSLKSSNNVIKIISDRLIGVETRWGVSDMERAVLVGANMNTNANFRIRLHFNRLKSDIGAKNELIKFLDTLVANLTKDIELLKGTENEATARQAKETNLAVKKLVLEFIDNVNVLNGLEKDISGKLSVIGNDVDQIVAESSQALFGTIKGYFSTIIGVILVVSVIGILVNFLLGKTISGSLMQLNILVKDLAEGDGDLTKRIKVKSRDETGELAKWINLFIEKLQAILKEVSGNADSLNSSSSQLTAISEQMSEGARQASDKCNTVAAAAEEMNANMTSVAAASEQAATNVEMVAGSSEEMAITVREIAKSSEKARAITSDAVAKAGGATANINKLGEAAHEITKVTEVITEISEQTNLLALNATIEAARAGEAGKGFAVVANEIKELAKQTAEATQEIKAKIDGIQQSSSLTVDEINTISQVINEIDTIVGVIATAVEEQSSSTQEIAGNVVQASKGIKEVNGNVAQSSTVSGQIAHSIADVNQTAGMLADNSAQVSTSAGTLAQLSGKLHQMVGRFKL